MNTEFMNLVQITGKLVSKAEQGLAWFHEIIKQIRVNCSNRKKLHYEDTQPCLCNRKLTLS